MHCGNSTQKGGNTAWNRGKSLTVQVSIEPDRLLETRDCPAPGSAASDLRLVACSVADSGLVYDLRRGGGSSGCFYSDVARFSAKLLAEIELRAASLLDSYSRYVQESVGEAARSRGEYAIELLTLGLALRRYEGAAESTPRWVVRMARGLFWLRRRSLLIKAAADLLRSCLAQFFLVPNIGKKATGWYSVRQLPRLIAWLQATGEFEQEAARLNNWLSFLATFPTAKADRWLETAAELFDGFEGEAAKVLGSYTRGVPGFLASEYAHRGIREDRIFCGKLPVEYHLSMVAAEIMNRGLRAEFERTRSKAVLVPACMRGDHAATCKAREDGVDITCTGCTPGCNVNRITRRMRSLGAAVYLVPHSTGFSRWLERWQREPDTGVTAVACMLNILPGGYEMRARGIASQCVPLDYPGCQKHWRREGIATDLNEERLVGIVSAGH